MVKKTARTRSRARRYLDRVERRKEVISITSSRVQRIMGLSRRIVEL